MPNALEPLEARRFLSATASVEIIDQTLFVTAGDTLRHVTIQGNDEGGHQVRVTERPSSPVSPVGIIETFEPSAFSSIHVVGSDSFSNVIIYEATVPTGGSVLAGEAGAFVRIIDSNINGDLYLRGSDSRDFFDLSRGTIEGLVIDARGGDDFVRLGDVTVWNYVSLLGGEGSDQFNITRGTEIFGFTYINGGSGSDSLFTDDSNIAGGLWYVGVEDPLFA